MACVAKARCGPTRTGSALALVLAALIAIEAPARAQVPTVAEDGSSAALTQPAPSGDAQIAPISQPGEELLIAADVEVAENPSEPGVLPGPLAVTNAQATDRVVFATALADEGLAPGDATTPGDPLERTNRAFFKTQSSIDRAVFRPVAQAYQRVVPKPVRSGLRNFLRNLIEPIIFVNDLLQLRPGRAVRTLGRFAINSTVGLGGIIDVAKAADLPYRSNGFGNTLGRYGVGPGPYLYLPLIGPTTLRDLLGGQVDGLALPVGVGFPFDRLDYQLGRNVISTIDKRAEAEADLQALLSGAADPYATLRSVYLQSREAAIADVRGKPIELAPLDDPLVGPAIDPAADAAVDAATTPHDPVEGPPGPLPAEAPAGE